MEGKIKTLRRYLRIWRRSIVINFSILAASRLDFFTFVIAKLVRMGFFLVFVVALFGHVPRIAGYHKGEVLLFFAVMNFIDIFVQLVWYRGMTDLKRLISRGDFDLVLTKPMSPLFWTAFRIFDFFDLTTVPAAIAFLWYALHVLGRSFATPQILASILMLCLSLVLAFAINLILASITFWTTEIDNAWWIYRDTIYVARFPPTIYPIALRSIFTFVFPILVIVTYPTRALLGELSSLEVLWAVVATALFLAIAMLVWRKALQHYASASS